MIPIAHVHKMSGEDPEVRQPEMALIEYVRDISRMTWRYLENRLGGI
jgi:dolichyl-phosphate-mannose--protein O-mannosyl transferase